MLRLAKKYLLFFKKNKRKKTSAENKCRKQFRKWVQKTSTENKYRKQVQKTSTENKCRKQLKKKIMKTIDSFIKELQAVSEDKRKLPLVIIAPNGLTFEPTIKRLYDDHFENVDKMVICYD